MKKELLDRLAELQKKFDSIQNNLGLSEKKSQLIQLQNKMGEEGFWDNPDIAQSVSQKSASLNQYIQKWENISATIVGLSELIDAASENEITYLVSEVEEVELHFQKGEKDAFLSGEYDSRNAIVSLHVGNGGQDAEDFTHILERMYLRFSEEKDWKIQILDESLSDVGLKSAALEITGSFAYGLLKGEHGVHRLIRLSPFNAKNLRQTSFARVEVLPVIENDTDVQIDESDIRIDVFRSSGNGGQSVNTTDSAVRITYTPLNIVVTCQNEKSQLQNKQSAMKVLKSRLLQLKLEQRAEKIDELRGDMMENSFGSQIRTYTLQPYKLVKDHRTNFEHAYPEKVFDGDLDGFIDAFLRD